MDFNLTQEQLQIRDEIRKVCGDFPDAYWREVDRQKDYPDAFVRKLSELGWLAALIPEEFGGTGLGITEASIILGRDQPLRRRRHGVSRADVHHGNLASATATRSKATLPTQDRQRRTAPAGFRRHRAQRRFGINAHPNHGDAQRATVTSSTARRFLSPACCNRI